MGVQDLLPVLTGLRGGSGHVEWQCARINVWAAGIEIGIGVEIGIGIGIETNERRRYGAIWRDGCGERDDVEVFVTSYSLERGASKNGQGSNHPYAELTAKRNG